MLVIIYLILIGCSHKGQKIKIDPVTRKYTICIGEGQKLLSQITTTHITKKYSEGYIECKGYIRPSINNQVIVSPPVQGVLKNIFIRQGEYVEKGKTLALLENSEIISLQENYLITKSEYDYLKEDFTRQGELSIENATSLKIMQQAQNEFRKTEAKLYSLKKMLNIIGINCDSVRIDRIQSIIELKAPISGKVNLLNSKSGALCSVENPLCEITGTNGQNIYINLNESQDVNVNLNQPIEFSVSTSPDIIYKSKIYSILPACNDLKKIEVYADLPDNREFLTTETPVNARILTKGDSVDVLPEEAIIRSREKNYVIIRKEDNCFELNEINIGKKIENMCLILTSPDNTETDEFVVKGSEILYEKIKMSEKEFR
jgi:membrane fusion protein, heavy metal efflux system